MRPLDEEISSLKEVRAQVADLAGQIKTILKNDSKGDARSNFVERPKQRADSVRSGLKVKLERYSGTENEDWTIG